MAWGTTGRSRSPLMPDESSAKGRPAPVVRPNAREVEIVRPDYQPRAAELEEDVRVDASFDEAVEALTKPVRIRYVDRPETAE